MNQIGKKGKNDATPKELKFSLLQITRRKRKRSDNNTIKATKTRNECIHNILMRKSCDSRNNNKKKTANENL